MIVIDNEIEPLSDSLIAELLRTANQLYQRGDYAEACAVIDQVYQALDRLAGSDAASEQPDITGPIVVR